jgi:hypothetical protein
MRPTGSTPSKISRTGPHTCPDCKALRNGGGSVQKPHDGLNLIWNSNEGRGDFVYYCRSCQTVMIRNLGDLGRQWK